PFTDPGSIDRVVNAVACDGADYAIEMDLPTGVTAEALTFDALAFIDNAAVDASHREHVTLYAKQNPDALRCAFLQPRSECRRPDLSFTVDTLDQYRYARAVAGRLPAADFELKNLIALADAMNVEAAGAAV